MTTERQKISVPFIWEERPGIPNKDWKPRDHKPSDTLKFVPTIKLIPSIPFDWEDKPGTPLPAFLLPFPPQFAGDSGIIKGKPAATLGELMMMSRRRTYPGKAKHMQKQRAEIHRERSWMLHVWSRNKHWRFAPQLKEGIKTSPKSLKLGIQCLQKSKEY